LMGMDRVNSNIGARMAQSAANTPTSPGTTAAPRNGLSASQWGQIGTAAATVAPNIANIFLQNKLRGPKAPQLESDIRLQRISPDAELAASNRAYNQAKQTLTTNTAQGSNLASGVGNLLAKRLAAQNQTYGGVNALNTQIGNQETTANQAARFRNNQLTNQFNQNTQDFRNAKLMMTSENIANLSNKVQSYARERNMMKRDSQALNLLHHAYGDSAVMERVYGKDPGLYTSLQDSLGKKSNKLGGRLAPVKRSKNKNC
jgi:hypothetical protein